MRRSTRSDVAERAGVSKTTVTFVLGERYDIAIPESTRDRVRQAARDLGYHPNAVAQALASGKTGAITVAFPNLLVPNYFRFLRAIESQTNIHGYHLIASTIGRINNASNILPDLWAVLNSPCDAVILVDAHELIKPVINEIMPFHKPVIAMGIYDAPGIDCVEVNMLPATTAAISQLLEANPRRLAYFGFGSAEEAAGVMCDASNGRGDYRVVEYVRAITEAGRPLEVIHGSHSGRRANIQLLREYIERHGCPDAIFCYDDEHAISAHYCLRHMGLRLPDDVLLVGCDGNEECEYLEPPITTIVLPVDEMCAHAWNFLDHRLNGKAEARQHIRLNAELIVRESSIRAAT